MDQEYWEHQHTESKRAVSPSTSTHSPPRKSNDSLRRWYWCTAKTKSLITQTTLGGIYPRQRLWHIESRLRNIKRNKSTRWIQNINYASLVHIKKKMFVHLFEKLESTNRNVSDAKLSLKCESTIRIFFIVFRFWWNIHLVDGRKKLLRENKQEEVPHLQQLDCSHTQAIQHKKVKVIEHLSHVWN